MYHNSPDGKLSQGDILRKVRIMANITNRTGDDAKYREGNIIVITRNCEIDKPSDTVLVARVTRLAGQAQRYQSLIRGDESVVVVNAFYLPPDGQFIPEECFIDWRTLQPISKDMLKLLRPQQDHYICTLDEEIRMACLESFTVFFTKPEDEENEQLADAHQSLTQRTGTP